MKVMKKKKLKELENVVARLVEALRHKPEGR
jgi:hypothetical protein